MRNVQKQKPNRFTITRRIGLSLSLQLLITFSSSMAALGESQRRFTVRDSIEMNRFIYPNPYLQSETPISPEMFSPSGKQLILVTQRGKLATNQVEDTIWLFDVNILRKCVEAGSTCPPPHALLRLAGITSSLDNESRVITDLRWWRGDEDLMFIGRDGGNVWHLYTLEVASETLHQLTPDDQNVSQFEMSEGLILYTAAEPYHQPSASQLVVATGRTLSSLLFPDELAVLRPNRDQLWLLRNGKSVPMVNPETGKRILINRNLTGVPKEVLSISPDGRHAIVNVAVTTLPSTWEKYVPGFFTNQLKHVPDELLQYEDADEVPERYVLVDLDRGTTTVMLNAPLGRTLGYVAGARGAQAGAVWSRDSRRAVLVNLFLPLGMDNAERAPAIVCYDLTTNKWTYVAPFKEAKNEAWFLSHVAWQDNQGEVVLQYSEGGPAPETYRLQSGEWKLSENPNREKSVTQSQSRPAPPLTLSIRQDLNSPPLLFANSDSPVQHAIWDPNPQLREFDLGQAAPYRWRDKEGREIKGILFKPPHFAAGKRYPLVIEPRMYSEHGFVTDGTYATAAAARPLAAADILVLQAGEPADPLTNMDNSEWFRSQMFGAIGGYEAAVAQLVSDGLVDAKRVGVVGFSRTCWNVTFALTHNPHLFSVATIADGITYDYFQYLQSADDKTVIDQLLVPYGAQPVGRGLENWLKRAPDFSLDQVDAPLRIEAHEPATLLLNWGTYSMLRILNRPVDLIMLPGASHVVSMPLDLLESQQGDVDWFRFWLQGYEDPDPAKSEQYGRWEGLRQLRLDYATETSSQSQSSEYNLSWKYVDPFRYAGSVSKYGTPDARNRW